MKSGTEGALRLAHALVQAGEQVEVFTIGTRLTRVTRALVRRNREQALVLASGLVADWDGGTRLGEALQVFLSVPRFASFAAARDGRAVRWARARRTRGNDPGESRLSAWAVRLWLATPLAADPQFLPQTAALKAVLPVRADLIDGSSIASLHPHSYSRSLGLNRRRRNLE